MSAPILATKLYVPQPQPNVVSRSRLIARLDEGGRRKLTLISASAGFGKTTLVSAWVAGGERPVAWLSLDEGDSAPTRFLAHLVGALQTVVPDIGQGVLDAFRSPQPPASESILTSLLNEVATIPNDFILVLDDYHVVDGGAVDDALGFLIEHMPPQMHVVIATREDPPLPLARLRVRGQLTELRAADLRFTPAEAAEFLNRVMGLNVSLEDVAALETRTEGWIAGLQLAAISMRGHDDTTSFIQSFTGSHRFILDYLMEEVLQQQSDAVQAFLLHTSVLDRMSGPLCDAVLGTPTANGQATLEYLERANLFTVPLDDERRWYRYHHLFGELLRQRLQQSAGDAAQVVANIHVRASEWFEGQGLEIEAFRHAAAANDIERAERLIQGQGTPLYVRGGIVPITNWLSSLPEPVLDVRPSLWVAFATVTIMVGKISRGTQRIEAAEAALQRSAPDEQSRYLVARIADLRSLVGVLAADPHYLDVIIAQGRRPPAHSQTVPPAALWKLGLAHFYRGDRGAAGEAFTEAVTVSEATGNVHVIILATTSLGKLRELDNQLRLAERTFQRVLQLVGDPPGPVACEAFVGLARIAYEWDDLEAAQRHGLQSVTLARQLEQANFIASEVFLARLQLAHGDVDGALAALARTEQAARERDFHFWLPDVVGTQVLALLHQGKVSEAADLAQAYGLPLGQARVHLAQGDPSAALATLMDYRRQVHAQGWARERLKAMVLEAIALDACGDRARAVQVLGDALALAEPEGCIRTFVDEGPPMAYLLAESLARGVKPDYTTRLLQAFDLGQPEPMLASPVAQPLAEPLSQRELEVLQLIAQGLSNRDIADRLFLAESSVKGHNRNIFGKLQVQRRTEAVARARELGLV